jgi:hypothetical protein
MTDPTSRQRGRLTETRQQLSHNNLRTESNIWSQVSEWAQYFDILTKILECASCIRCALSTEKNTVIYSIHEFYVTVADLYFVICSMYVLFTYGQMYLRICKDFIRYCLWYKIPRLNSDLKSRVSSWS